MQKADEEGYPTEVEEREAYFMNEVAVGEQLLAQGDGKAVEAALCFYRALKVYPDQKNLLGIYEKTVPKVRFEIFCDGSGGRSVLEGHMLT